MRQHLPVILLHLCAQCVFGQEDSIRLMLPSGHVDMVFSALLSSDGNLALTASMDGTVVIWDAVQGVPLRTLNTGRAVYKAVFSPSGKVVLSEGDDGTIQTWETRTGRLVSRIEGDSASIHFALFDPTGEKILVVRDGRLSMWDAVGSQALFSRAGHSATIHTAVFSRDGKSFLTVDDRTICIWGAITGEQLHILNWKSGLVGATRFTPDGKQLISASEDGVACLWDVRTGSCLQTIKGQWAEARSGVFSPDGKKLLTEYYDKGATIWDIQNEEFPRELEGSSELSDSKGFSPDGNMVLGRDLDVAKLWDAKTGMQLHSLDENEGGILETCFSDEGSKVLTTSISGSTKIWDSNSGKLLQSLETEFPKVFSATFSPDGIKVLTTSSDSVIRIWAIGSGEQLLSHKERYWSIQARYSTDGEKVIAASEGDTVRIWDADSGALLVSLEGCSGGDKSVSISSDGKKVLTSSAWDETATIWDAESGAVLARLKGHSKPIVASVFSVNGGKALTASEDNTVRIWDAERGGLLHVLDGNSFSINSVAFSDDGQNVLAAFFDGTVRVWDASSGTLLHNLEAHANAVMTATFSPDGKKVLTASWDGNAGIWDAQSGSLLHLLKGHRAGLYSAEFSPDGRSVLTASSDGTAKIWGVQSGALNWNLGGQSHVFQAHFTPDGKQVVVASAEGNITLWDVWSGKKVVQVFGLFDRDALWLLPDGHYKATPKAAALLHYVKGLQSIGFDQLDVKYNRPDKVLEALGKAFGDPDIELINAYHRAWQKRMAKLDIDTTSFEDGFSFPECDVMNRNELGYERTEDQLQLHIKGGDARYALDRFNVWVNGVPVFGEMGCNIRAMGVHEWDTTLYVTLSSGENRIETSVRNVNGIESYRVPLYVRYTPVEPAVEKVWFVGLGVDHYLQPGHDLNFSTKDVRDLAALFKEHYGNRIIIDTLLDEQVTRANVHALKEKLRRTGVNDKVVVSFSGHGLLDDRYDYYLATHDVDFAHPASSGLPYEDVEWLLDSIPARKKLLLIDACHSGEVDKEELLAFKTTLPQGTRGQALEYDYAPVLGTKNSFDLMQDLFANVNRGTGATVISASGGTQFAYEGSGTPNGVFTYSMLELLREKEQVTVGELKTRVSERVEELTGGLQKPTSRNETLEYDWIVW